MHYESYFFFFFAHFRKKKQSKCWETFLASLKFGFPKKAGLSLFSKVRTVFSLIPHVDQGQKIRAKILFTFHMTFRSLLQLLFLYGYLRHLSCLYHLLTYYNFEHSSSSTKYFISRLTILTTSETPPSFLVT